MATTTTIDDAQLDAIEHAIETLDTADFFGEPTLHPTTQQFVSDAEYDRLYGKNGSERAILKKHRPDSRIFKGVNNVKADLAKATKCIHDPPMTSIDKADGSKVKKYKRLGEWMLDCLGRMKIDHQPYTRDLFKLADPKAEDPAFVADILQVEKALAVLANKRDSSGEVVFVQSLKHDGCAVRTYWKRSRLNAAGSRPKDGVNGWSVIDHVRHVTGVPNSLLLPNLDLIIGGEVEQTISDFEKTNATAKAAGEKTYENPRNSTAGAMNPLGDPKVAGKRKLRFVGYTILNHENPPYKTVMDRAKWANKVLKVPFIRVNPFQFEDLEKIENEVRAGLDYGIDGIILEVNDLDAAERMGNQGDNPTGDPRAKLAWKFSAERGKATVARVRHEMKRTGKLSCVAEFPPVRLAGTNNVNCTLHNAKYMIDNGVGTGAVGLIYKGGEIIPYWEKTLVPAKVTVPTECPSCNSKLEWSATKVDLLCKNDLCPARHIDGLVHYLKTLGVKGISDSTVTCLVERGVVKTFGDFYRIDPKVLVRDAGYSQREAILDYARVHMIEQPDKEKDDLKLLAKADKAAAGKKTIPLAKFIAALGIPGSGKGTGASLSDKFVTLDAIRKASAVDFETAKDIGDKTANTLFEWFSKNGPLLDDLLQYVEIEKVKTGMFSGKNFVFSGSFNPSKEHYIALVEEEGGRAQTAPSRKTHYFVHGPGSGNKKDAAEQLKKDGTGINIIEIEDLEKLMGLDKDDSRAF